MDKALEWLKNNSDLLIHYGIQTILAIVIFIVGNKIAKFVGKLTAKGLEKRKVDKAVASFLSSIVHALVFAAVILMALSQLGIQTTSFVAILGAAGLAIGLALQGSLSNFASGVLIIILRRVIMLRLAAKLVACKKLKYFQQNYVHLITKLSSCQIRPLWVVQSPIFLVRQHDASI